MTLQKIRCKMVRKKAAGSIQSFKENDKEVVCGKAHERRLPFFCVKKERVPGKKPAWDAKPQVIQLKEGGRKMDMTVLEGYDALQDEE